MATKKKTKKQVKSKRTAGKKLAPMKMAIKHKLAKKRVTPKKKLAKKKAAPKKAKVKTKAGGKKTTGGETAGALKEQVRGKIQSVEKDEFAIGGVGARTDEQYTSCVGSCNDQNTD